MIFKIKSKQYTKKIFQNSSLGSQHPIGHARPTETRIRKAKKEKKNQNIKERKNL